MTVYILEFGEDSYDAHKEVHSVHSNFESAYEAAKTELPYFGCSLPDVMVVHHDVIFRHVFEADLFSVTITPYEVLGREL